MKKNDPTAKAVKRETAAPAAWKTYAETARRKARDDAPALREALLGWYARAARDWPWRRVRLEGMRGAVGAPDLDYRSWLSEILFQQTRIEQGLPYYERFLRQFPDVAALAAAPEAAVMKAWEGLGYYSRARNLHAAARRVAESGGRFPDAADGWQALPGVGRYTAGMLAAVTRGAASPTVDGNVRRVLARWFALPVPPASSAGDRLLWELAAILIPGALIPAAPPVQPASKNPVRPAKTKNAKASAESSPQSASPGYLSAWIAANPPGAWNEALMELGQTHCLPKRPSCAACPAFFACEAGRGGRTAAFPVAAAKKRIPHKLVVAAAIRREGRHDGRYLVGLRANGGMLAGLWEFPGGKVEAGETPEAALARELEEELGVKNVRIGTLLGAIKHAYTHFTMTLSLYDASLPKGARPQALKHAELRWVDRAGLEALALPTSDRRLLPCLAPEG